MADPGATGDRGDDRETQQRTFVVMNERPVDDISLEFFYKPHTITLLIVSIIGVMYFAFIRSVFTGQVQVPIRHPGCSRGMSINLSIVLSPSLSLLLLGTNPMYRTTSGQAWSVSHSSSWSFR